MNWRNTFNTDVSFIKELLDSTSLHDTTYTLTASNLEASENLSWQNIVYEDGLHESI